MHPEFPELPENEHPAGDLPILLRIVHFIPCGLRDAIAGQKDPERLGQLDQLIFLKYERMNEFFDLDRHSVHPKIIKCKKIYTTALSEGVKISINFESDAC